MKKFLICGLGSIGQRHVRMIQAVTNGEAEIAAYRSRRLDIVISDRLEATFGTSPEEHYGLRSFDDLDAALAWRPDAVFVTNPISMHLATALAAAKAGCHVFIEKPLDCDPAKVAELGRVLAEQQLTCMVGYQMRYHPGYRKIKDLIAAGALGRLVSADLHFGEWLPGAHPYEDYREAHMSRKDQGGGVVLCLSHEIDLACWLFGKPSRLVAFGGHLSDLTMDVEDTADILMSVPNAGREIPVHIHLDFLQRPARRYMHVVGDKASLLFDPRSGRLEINSIAADAPEVHDYAQFQRNEMFLAEVREFIASAKARKAPPITFEEGATVLGICLAAKRSLETRNMEAVS